MDEYIVNEVLDNTEFKHSSFYQQVFKLLEDMRVLNAITRIRPSMKAAIDMRKRIRLNYTESQINVYRTKTMYTDLIFLYLEKSLLTEDFTMSHPYVLIWILLFKVCIFIYQTSL